MFLCTYSVPKASSYATFTVIFATRRSIICFDSGIGDTIRVSLALAIRFFDIPINRYTPSPDYEALGQKSLMSSGGGLQPGSVKINNMMLECKVFKRKGKIIGNVEEGDIGTMIKVEWWEINDKLFGVERENNA